MDKVIKVEFDKLDGPGSGEVFMRAIRECQEGNRIAQAQDAAEAISVGPWSMKGLLSELKEIRRVFQAMLIYPDLSNASKEAALIRLNNLLEVGTAHVARIEGMDIRERSPSPDMEARVLASIPLLALETVLRDRKIRELTPAIERVCPVCSARPQKPCKGLNLGEVHHGRIQGEVPAPKAAAPKKRARK